jgi:hypothetical protein
MPSNGAVSKLNGSYMSLGEAEGDLIRFLRTRKGRIAVGNVWVCGR